MIPAPLVRYGSPCIAGLVTAFLIWAIAALAGYPEVAPWADFVIALLAIVFAVSLLTGGYLGRPSATYLDNGFSPLISGAGALQLVLFAVSLIVGAFISAAVSG